MQHRSRFIVFASIATAGATLAATALGVASIGTITEPSTTAASTSEPADTDFEKTLEAINAKSVKVKELSAGFEQRRYSALMREPLVSRGTVNARESQMLWATTEPEPTRMLVDGQRLQIYYVKQSLIEDYSARGNLAAIASSPLPRLSALREQFRLVPDYGEGLPAGDAAHVRAVRLLPRDAEVARHVDHVRVLLDEDRGVVLAMEVTDPEGDRTEMTFQSIRVNPALSDEAFRLNAPAGTKVVRPLEPDGAGGNGKP